jgi:superfamily II DNA or RNA helicase
VKFKAKVKVLVADLKAILSSDPGAKVLIFSQFSETLRRLKRSLERNGYQYRELIGSMSRAQRTKALRDFQQDPPTTVFLLSTRAGAVGINLTQANHVFLMEPSFNVALEAQAIGRVYRMGQQREVSVTRLVIANSVESRMIALRPGGAASATSAVRAGAPAVPDVGGGGGSGGGGGGGGGSGGGGGGSGSALVGSIRAERMDARSMDFSVLFGVSALQAATANGSQLAGIARKAKGRSKKSSKKQVQDLPYFHATLDEAGGTTMLQQRCGPGPLKNGTFLLRPSQKKNE